MGDEVKEEVEVKAEKEDLGVFDPSKKKKKKKVRIAEEGDTEGVTEKMDNLNVADEEAAANGDGESFAGLKKKKKKKKPVGDDAPEENEGDEAEGDDEVTTSTFSLPLKKKKKKKTRTDDEAAPEGDDENEEDGGEGAGDEEKEEEPTKKYPWEGTDRDYKYEELLDRVFGILRENNPELAGEKRRTIMKPPQVLREGTKKTVFANFTDLCKTMHRQPEHVMAFLLAELGTSGSLDGQQRLVVKGRFLPKVFEGVLRRYVNEYVMCNGCKSPDTILSKENRLFFLRCEQCGSSRSVAPIKAGFVARVGKRKATAG